MAVSSMSGSYAVLVDARGRLSFPAPLRSAIGDTLYISPDEKFREALVVRDEAGYVACCDRIREEGEKRGDHYLDIDDDVLNFCANTATVVPDKNGRITLPANLMKYAKITSGKAIVIGRVTHAEIWDAEGFENYMKDYNERREARVQAMREDRDGSLRRPRSQPQD